MYLRIRHLPANESPTYKTRSNSTPIWLAWIDARTCLPGPRPSARASSRMSITGARMLLRFFLINWAKNISLFGETFGRVVTVILNGLSEIVVAGSGDRAGGQAPVSAVRCLGVRWKFARTLISAAAEPLIRPVRQWSGDSP